MSRALTELATVQLDRLLGRRGGGRRRRPPLADDPTRDLLQWMVPLRREAAGGSSVATTVTAVPEGVANQVSVRDLKTHRPHHGCDASGLRDQQPAIDAGLISCNGQRPNLPPPVKLRGQRKLLVDEAQSDQMRRISTTVDAIGVCRISWAETMAAPARLQRDDPDPILDNLHRC